MSKTESQIPELLSFFNEKIFQIEATAKTLSTDDYMILKDIEITNRILEEVCSSPSIDIYFKNNEKLISTFLEFSEKLVHFLLDKKTVNLEDQDKIIFLFNHYCSLFIRNKSQAINLSYIVNQIFDLGKPFYKSFVINHQKGVFQVQKKLKTPSEYNEPFIDYEKNLPLFSKGEIVDVQKPIINSDLFLFSGNNEDMSWTKGKIIDVNDTDYIIKVPFEKNSFVYNKKKDASKIAKENEITKYSNWRSKLEEYEVIFCYEQSNYSPATVLRKIENYDPVSDMKFLQYRIGFRVYLDLEPNWEQYFNFWEKEVMRDSQGKKFIGCGEEDDETIPEYSKRLARTKPTADKSSQLKYNPEQFYVDNFIPFNDKIFVNGRNYFGFSENAMKLFNNICSEKGYEALIEKIDYQNTPDTIVTIFDMLLKITPFLHKDYISRVSEKAIEKIKNYLKNFNETTIRTLTKETYDTSIAIICFFQDSMGTPKDLDSLGLLIAFKLLKTTVFQSKITGVKILLDMANAKEIDKENLVIFLQKLKQQNIIEIIYGKESHLQLMNNSKKIFELLVDNNLLDEKDFRTILSHNDYSTLIEIYKMINDINSNATQAQVNIILDILYEKKPEESINEEIETIYFLSRKENFEKTIDYFFQVLFNENNDKVNVLVLSEKIFCLTKFEVGIWNKVYKECLDRINRCSFSIFCMKIMQKVLANAINRKKLDREKNKIEPFATFNHEEVVNCFKNNLILFVEKVKQYRKKNENAKPNQKVIIENKHPIEISVHGRFNFARFLLQYKIWNIDAVENENPISFLYNVFVIENILPQVYFTWVEDLICKKLIGKTSIDILYDIFEKNNPNKYVEAFQCFVRVFAFLLENSRTGAKERENHKGYSILWEVIFSSNNEGIITKAINILFQLYKNNNIDSLINKCAKILLEKNSKKERCIKIFMHLIQKSEMIGTFGVKSHESSIKESVVKINVISLIRRIDDLSIRVYNNMTVWELKKVLSSLINISSDFLNISMSKQKLTLNSLTMGELVNLMKSKNNSLQIILTMNQDLIDSIKREELLIEDEMNPRLKQIFYEWFDIFSSNNKMYNENCARFIQSVTNTHKEVEPDDNRIVSLLNEYDKNKKGFLNREEFISFFEDAVKSPQKHFTVWENLYAMGYRNDLMKLSEDYFNFNNMTKDNLLRYSLAQNDELFTNLLNEENAFVNCLCNNQKITQEVYNVESTLKIISEKGGNLFKLTYYLEIIESVIEELEFPPNEVVKEYKVQDSEPGINKEEWIKKFILNDGIEKIISLVIDIKDEEPNSKKCRNVLVKLLNTFFKAYCNTFDISKEINKKLRDEDHKEEEEQENNLADELQLDLAKNQSSGIENESIGYIQKIFIDKNITQHFEKALKNKPFIQFLFDLTVSDFTNESYEILSTLVSLSTDEEIVPMQNFIDLSLKHLPGNPLVVKIASKLCYMNSHFHKIKMINQFIEAITPILKKGEQLHREYYQIFSHLAEIYFNDKSTLVLSTDITQIIYNEIDKINNEINTNTIKDVLFFVEKIKFITRVINTNKNILTYITNKYVLVKDIITKLLFNDYQEEFNRIKSISERSINYQKFSSGTSITNSYVRYTCFNFILSLIQNPSNLEQLFSFDLISALIQKNEREKYQKSIIERKEDHIGLRNLRFICYMISILQQFYMIPVLRYAVLQIDDGEKIVKDENGYDDNALHQLQRMFSYLDYSQRSDFIPDGFCYALKDFEGNRVNINIQQDSSEFLYRFFSLLEDAFRKTKYKYLLENIFGGKLCTSLKCKSCGFIKKTYDQFSSLTLQVKHINNLYSSISKYTAEDIIEDYKCENCLKRTQVTKSASFYSLPNNLIICLQRIIYDYENEINRKINSYLEFPEKLNMKKFCTEVVFGTEEKSEEYYEYTLVGVNVHLGTANQGHYFSLINCSRDGKENTMSCDLNNWLKFNDSEISKYDRERIVSECFGNTEQNEDNDANSSMSFFSEFNQSAYMLFYERNKKHPIKVVYEGETTGKTVLTEDGEDYYMKMKGEKESFEKYEKELYDKVYVDKNNQKYVYIPYYSYQPLIPKEYFIEIFQDNFEFMRVKNIHDDHFINFIYRVMEEILNQKVNEETKDKSIYMNLMIINLLLSRKEKMPYLIRAKEQLFSLLTMPGVSSLVYRFIFENIFLVKLNLLNSSKKISKIHLDIIYHLISNYYDEKKVCMLLNEIFNFYLQIYFKLISKSGPLNSFLRIVLVTNRNILHYFLNRKLIPNLITFLINKESPSSTMQGYESTNYFIPDYEEIVELLIFIYKNKENLNYLLTEMDMKCYKCEGMIHFLMQNSSVLLGEYVSLFTVDDYYYTMSSCSIILSSIDGLLNIGNNELKKIITIVFKLLEIKDSLSFLRKVLLLGFNQIVFENNTLGNDNYNYPCCGINVDKWVNLITLRNQEGFNCLFEEILNIKEREQKADIFYFLLTLCSKNPEAFDYVKGIICHNGRRYIDEGLDILELSIRSNEYKKHLKKIFPDETVFSIGSVKFIEEYVIGDTVREEISLVYSDEICTIVRCDYYTKIQKFFIPGMKKNLNEVLRKQSNDNNLAHIPTKEEKSDESTVYYNQRERNRNDSRFIHTIFPELVSGKKVVVESEDESNSYFTVVRFLFVKSIPNQRLCVSFSVKYEMIGEKNEFDFKNLEMSHEFSNGDAHTLLTINKINPALPFGFDLTTLTLDQITIRPPETKDENGSGGSSFRYEDMEEEFDEDDANDFMNI